MIDLTIITNIMLADGIGRQGIGLIGALKDDLSMNVLIMPPALYHNIPTDILSIIKKPVNEHGTFSFWTYILGLNDNIKSTHSSIKSKIKVAYSMFESDAIPKLWVDILNKYYDILAVPDPWVEKVYRECGVTIPTFVLPLGIMVENLLNRELPTKHGDPFVFGLSAGFWERKGHIKLLNIFKKYFGNDPKFKLNLHGRFGPYRDSVEKAVAHSGIKNVQLVTGQLPSAEYDKFMGEIDCYVFPSKGEGFSITPREAIALGKPCILSNNSAHKTICDSGYVVPIEANTKVPAIYEVFGNKQIGWFYDCDGDELGRLMKDVADNYGEHLKRVAAGREWVRLYLWSSLRPTYMSLFKPKNIIVGEKNLITPDMVETTSASLADKLKGV